MGEDIPFFGRCLGPAHKTQGVVYGLGRGFYPYSTPVKFANMGFTLVYG